MVSESKDVFLTVVVPALGAIISLLMYGSPVSAVLHASKTRTLGDLNPIPFAVTVANCIVWCTYGLIKQDPFVTAPNAPGVVIAMFCALTAFGLADEKIRTNMRLLLCVEMGILSFLGVLTSFATENLTQQLSIWGLAGNVISLVYYAAPLSTMAQVVRTRNSASILLPLTITNTANAALWTTYGLALMDVYIYLPNGIGLVLSCAQLLLSCVYPSRPQVKAQTAAGTLHEAPYSRLHEEELSGSATARV